jgi:hypothetical protein
MRFMGRTREDDRKLVNTKPVKLLAALFHFQHASGAELQVCRFPDPTTSLSGK